ncbi:hypothetical protein P3T16_005537 [Paraburkholderia sp. GAS42]|jgi:hypothetical protein
MNGVVTLKATIPDLLIADGDLAWPSNRPQKTKVGQRISPRQ